MTRDEELIGMLKILKEQARKSRKDIAVIDVKIDSFIFVIDEAIKALKQEPQTFKWCTDCKEYDQEKHCCHRWSKVIRDTVEEMKQEQEPVLDKIRAEMEFEVDHRTNMLCAEDVFAILDKYKAEVEPQESEDNE